MSALSRLGIYLRNAHWDDHEELTRRHHKMHDDNRRNLEAKQKKDPARYPKEPDRPKALQRADQAYHTSAAYKDYSRKSLAYPKGLTDGKSPSTPDTKPSPKKKPKRGR